MDKIIKNGHVIDKKNALDAKLDILISDGMIVKIGENIEKEGAEIIDAEGMYVSAGLIDMHVHLREPGYEYKEDIESGTAAAAAGGFTAVCPMPNTNPVCDNAVTVRYIKEREREAAHCRVFPIGAVTKGLKGEELAEIGEMKKEGIVAISDDGRPVSNGSVMRRAMQYADGFDLQVISHCEDLSLLDGGQMNDSVTATLMGLRPIVPAVEEAMVARDILIAEHEGKKIHIAHVSTKNSVDLVRQAKKRGVKVTCETAPHYFVLTDKAVEGFDTNAKMNPPLRDESDREAIIEGLCDGTIDCIITDHAPHHIDEKRVEFEKALNGIVGLETSLGLSITYLVKSGRMTLGEMLEKMTYNPSHILNLDLGEIAVGKIADLTIFDPDEEWVVDVNKFHSKSKNSPFDGFKLQGKAHKTLIGGEIIYNG
ncbi:MAG: dihydroorotase [Clostridia bacterium]|nr:dihydroorotase [Clostridia bacterium]